MSTFSERLRSLIPNHYTVADFAKSIQYPVGTVSRWLSGQSLPNGRAFAAITKATNCDLHWLIMGESCPPKVIDTRSKTDLQATAARKALLERVMSVLPKGKTYEQLAREMLKSTPKSLDSGLCAIADAVEAGKYPYVHIIILNIGRVTGFKNLDWLTFGQDIPPAPVLPDHWRREGTGQFLKGAWAS